MKPFRITRMVPLVLVGLLTSLGQAAEKSAEGVMYLFVQSAESVRIDQDKVTMKGVSPTTIYFSDRPARIAGHMRTEDFVGVWSLGDESFELDNPNAALSVFTGDEVETITVVLSKPVLKRGNLSYTIKILDGKIPEKGGECSLFIDVIGRPRSPTSIAGVGRRTSMRHVVGPR
jgi:hypothetical protein